MKIMVTFNVETDLDIANGARGELVEIVLDEESSFSLTKAVVELNYPPAYVLIKLDHTKARYLENLKFGVIPLVPMQWTFCIMISGREEVVTQMQLPLTPAYAFTDYQSQGQTISNAIINIGSPPCGELTPFSIYVALSRAHGQDNICFLQDFDEKLLISHPSEYLCLEDQQLVELDEATEKWWRAHKSSI